MHIIHKDIRKGIIKIQLESIDDLWTLHLLLERGDIIRGKTYRKVKIGEETTEKRAMNVAIAVEKVEFSNKTLRALGKVIEGPDDVSRGSYHSFVIEVGTIIEVEKKEWLQYQRKRLEEAAAEKKKPLLICVLDREEAYIALSKRYGYELLATLKGDVQKKEERSRSSGSFYEEIIKALTDYAQRYDADTIILASPAFWKEELMKRIKDDILKTKIIIATCSSVKQDSIREVLTRPEVKEAVQRERIVYEMRLVDEILLEIARDGKVAYGKKEVTKAVAAGAVEKVLITDKVIHAAHEKESFHEIDLLLRDVEKTKGDIHIISSEHEAGARLDGLGGIAAKLRYKLENA